MRVGKLLALQSLYLVMLYYASGMCGYEFRVTMQTWSYHWESLFYVVAASVLYFLMSIFQPNGILSWLFQNHGMHCLCLAGPCIRRSSLSLSGFPCFQAVAAVLILLILRDDIRESRRNVSAPTPTTSETALSSVSSESVRTPLQITQEDGVTGDEEKVAVIKLPSEQKQLEPE